MPNAYKVLGQSNPAALTLTTLYTVPASTSAVASTLNICALGAASTIRVAIRPAGAAIANKHYILYNFLLNANDALPLTIGLSLATTDVVSVYASEATVGFTLFGTELT